MGSVSANNNLSDHNGAIVAISLATFLAADKVLADRRGSDLFQASAIDRARHMDDAGRTKPAVFALVCLND